MATGWEGGGVCFPVAFLLQAVAYVVLIFVLQRQRTPDSLCSGLQGKGSVFPVLVSGQCWLCVSLCLFFVILLMFTAVLQICINKKSVKH